MRASRRMRASSWRGLVAHLGALVQAAVDLLDDLRTGVDARGDRSQARELVLQARQDCGSGCARP